MKFINENFAVIGQIKKEQLKEVKNNGFKIIVNNRPDFESMDQPLSKELEKEAKNLGLDYYHIPVSGVSEDNINKLKEVLSKHKNEKILGFCASGNRTSMLYMMATK